MIHVPLAATAAVVRSVLARLCAFVMVVVLLGGLPARAAEPLEDQYLKLMTLMDRADMLREKGETEAAKAKYLEAEKGLLNIRRAYPSWNSKVLSFRLNYVAEKLNS